MHSSLEDLNFLSMHIKNCLHSLGNIKRFVYHFDADPPSPLRVARPPGLGSIKNLSLIDSLSPQKPQLTK
jgi:hypothetical protein